MAVAISTDLYNQASVTGTTKYHIFVYTIVLLVYPTAVCCL